MKKLMIALIGLSPWITLYAQKDSALHRTIVVENEYNPTVMDASKINVLPIVEEPTLAKKEAEYATAWRKIAAWDREPMVPIESRKKTETAKRGYLKAGYGNYGNVCLGTGYLWDMTNADRLKVDFALDGMNGNIPNKGFGRNGHWGARHYTTNVKALYNHLFAPVSLNAGGNYTSQTFTYMGVKPTDALSWDNRYRQRHTAGDFFVDVASRDKELPFQFRLQTGFQYFAQKHNPLEISHENENGRSPSENDDTAEKKIHATGDVWAESAEKQQIGIAFDVDHLRYSNSIMHNYTSVSLNPYYTLTDDVWRLRLGAHVDWFSGEKEGIDAAPNVKAEYIFSDSFILYAHADGGRQLNEYRKLDGVSPYWVLKTWLQPTYTRLDATVGLRAAPLNGLWFNIYGGYRIRAHETFAIPELINRSYYGIVFLQDKAKVPYVGAAWKYGYKDWFEVEMNASYFDWNIEGITGYEDEHVYAGKSKFIFDIDAKGKVYKGLTVGGGFYYVKRCGDFLNDVNDLHVGADYEFLKHVAAFARIHNLMNKAYDMIGYPQEKLNFLVGMKLRF